MWPAIATAGAAAGVGYYLLKRLLNTKDSDAAPDFEQICAARLAHLDTKKDTQPAAKEGGPVIGSLPSSRSREATHDIDNCVRQLPPSREWWVEVKTAPSAWGCHTGSRMSAVHRDGQTRVETHGPYVSESAAIHKARAERGRDAEFEDWADAYYGDAPPPYNSADGENYDSDEVVIISVISTAERERAAQEAIEHARAQPSPSVATLPLPPAGFVGFDPALALPPPDVGLFARSPAPTILGGRPHPPSAFPGGSDASGFVYCLERHSNRCHAIAAYVQRPGRGARYALFKPSISIDKVPAWIPPAGCARGGQHAPPPSALVDTVTPDLVSPTNGANLLSPASLRRAVSVATTHLFINALHDAEALAAAIRACGELTVCCLIECDVSPDVLAALTSKGATLRALDLSACTVVHGGARAMDGAWATLFAAAPQMIWVALCVHTGPPASNTVFDALPPSLHAFAYERQAERELQPSELEALARVSARLPLLRYLMVQPDRHAQSRVPLSGQPVPDEDASDSDSVGSLEDFLMRNRRYRDSDSEED